MINMDNGLLVVISGPSGAGKGTICRRLKEEVRDLKVSVSATTRKPREGEIEGNSYFFINEEDFIKRINNNEFLEYAKVYGNYYGTPKKEVFKQLEEGNDIILEIDIQGALQVKNNYPKGVFVFILPPSLTELNNRIEKRGTDSKEVILKRMQSAYDELDYAFEYDYVVVNDEIEAAVEKIKYIIFAEKNRAIRKKAIINKIREV
ncbi:MAG: guanylate kinase [Sedimentibacter sp.]